MMEREYVTLILGAGCSHPYGFPLGSDLISIISKRASQANNEIHRNGRIHQLNSILSQRYGRQFNISHYQQVLKEIHGQLTLYQPQSIDSFLGYLYSQQDENSLFFVDCIRYFIADVITAHYDAQKYFKAVAPASDPSKTKPKWLNHLCNAIFYYAHKNNYNFEESPLKIITFNYDTLLEQYFYELVHNSSFLTAERKKLVIDWFLNSIVHVYGQIGYIKWERKVYSAPEDVSPGEILDMEFLANRKTTDLDSLNHYKHEIALSCFHRIGLIPQRPLEHSEDNVTFRHNVTEVKKAKNWLSKSKTAIISGYAFDRTNNEILELQKNLKLVPQIFATIYGAGYALKSTAKELLLIHETSQGGYRRNFVLDGEELKTNEKITKGSARVFTESTLNLFSKELDIVGEILE